MGSPVLICCNIPSHLLSSVVASILSGQEASGRQAARDTSCSPVAGTCTGSSEPERQAFTLSILPLTYLVIRRCVSDYLLSLEAVCKRLRSEQATMQKRVRGEQSALFFFTVLPSSAGGPKGLKASMSQALRAGHANLTPESLPYRVLVIMKFARENTRNQG